MLEYWQKVIFSPYEPFLKFFFSNNEWWHYRKIKKKILNFSVCVRVCVCVCVFWNLSVPHCFFHFFSYLPFLWGGNVDLVLWVQPNILCRFGPTLAKNFLVKNYFFFARLFWWKKSFFFFYTWSLQFFSFVKQFHTLCGILWSGFRKTIWRDKRWTHVTYSSSNPLLTKYWKLGKGYNRFLWWQGS